MLTIYSVQCSFSCSIWLHVLQLWNLNGVFPTSIQECFIGWRCLSSNNYMKKICDFILPHVVWGIWKDRDNNIFRDSYSSPEMVFTKIKWAIFEILKYDGKSLLFRIKDELNLFNNWKISTSLDRNAKKDKRDRSKSSFPLTGWIKVNFDGASKGNPGPTRCGRVIRNNVGY